MAALSIWEKESFYRPRDIIIIGSGLSGLWAAYHLIKKEPSLSIAIVEKGIIPTGASTRNAGFACFGSLTELMHDRLTMGTDKMLQLVEMRHRGLEKIMQIFKPATIGFSLCGGYELLSSAPDPAGDIQEMNGLLAPVLNNPSIFTTAGLKIKEFGFSGIKHLVENKQEGYLHSGWLVENLLRMVQSAGVQVLTGMDIRNLQHAGSGFVLGTAQGIELRATQLLVCTNGFASQLVPGLDLVPARGQVLLTNEIPGLPFRGTFHADEGFYYFRNLGNRVLLGGARNRNFESETTSQMDTTEDIQQALEEFLQTHVIPGREYKITDRWSGIMAMGKEKMPIISETSTGLFCAVRMSGMGVALTPVVGEMIAAQMLGKP